MPNKYSELTDEVRVLELEVQKRELENRLTQLKSGDEGCIGCAGPCNVVDVAAKLQKELDSCRLVVKNFKILETQETDRLHKIILDMDVTISDLMDNDRKINGFLDEYRVTVENRDKTIEELKDRNFDDLKELYGVYEEELASMKSDYEIMRTNHYHSVAKLREDIRGLEVELSARKEDSKVLIKVIDEVRYRKSVEPHLNRTTEAKNSIVLNRLFELLDDYLSAPEGPSETPINDLYKVTVTYAFLEMP